MEQDPEVKEYIDGFTPEFREILYRLRELVYEVVPEVTESIKWGMPTLSFCKRKPPCAVKKCD